MKAISLHQPWATWVALGWKTIETRMHARFKGLVGQRIAIHAAQFVNAAEMRTNPYQPARAFDPDMGLIGRIKACRGMIVCIGTVTHAYWFDAYAYAEAPGAYEELCEKAMTSVAGKFLLFLEDIRPLLYPVLFHGRQGIFDVPNELIPEGCR
jgi:hypothetical protein